MPKPNIPEKFIHYVWEKGLLGRHFNLTSGDKCEIIHPGISGNTDGPDFENTQILIKNKFYAGNSEIHFQSSDWFSHEHNIDDAYEKIILHIVLVNNKTICYKKGKTIPTIVLPKETIENLYAKYFSNLSLTNKKIKCSEILKSIENKDFIKIANKLANVRFFKKTNLILEIFSKNKNWIETTWKAVSVAFGLPYNKIPFEYLSNTISWKMLMRAGDSSSIEAILFGQGGFLENKKEFKNSYEQSLFEEFTHIKNKYSLLPLDVSVWKNSPIRPISLPEMRIAQLSAVVKNVPDLFNKIILAKNLNDCYKIFKQSVSEFWTGHCKFETTYLSSGFIGKSAIDTIIINSVIPLKLAYAQYLNKKANLKESIEMINSINAEKNEIINIFVQSGKFILKNAKQSQGIIELYNEYCKKEKCMNCPIMNIFINKNDD